MHARLCSCHASSLPPTICNSVKLKMLTCIPFTLQGLHDMADAVKAVLELLTKARHVKPRAEKRAKPGNARVLHTMTKCSQIAESGCSYKQGAWFSPLCCMFAYACMYLYKMIPRQHGPQCLKRPSTHIASSSRVHIVMLMIIKILILIADQQQCHC
jgi:hypothetical protein